MTALIEVTNLSKSYSAHPVLKDLAFSVRDGESLAIIGPNGAGKTTLFKVLTGEVSIDKGSISFRSQKIDELSAHTRVAIGFGRTFQTGRVLPQFTSLENIIVAIEARCRIRGMRVSNALSLRPEKPVLREATQRLADMGLGDARFLEAHHLSHGDKKRLELAMVLALEPQVLMLDEPTAGMAPADRRKTVEMIKRLRSELGITIMLTEHDMDVVFGLSDRVMVLNYGEIITIGTPDEVRSNQTVADIYLGKGMPNA